MKQNDNEHRGFEKYCADNNIDNSMHPLHLLYLNNDTSDKLKAFKAGFLAGKVAALSEVVFTEDDALSIVNTAPEFNYSEEDIELVMVELKHVQTVLLVNRANQLLNGKDSNEHNYKH